MNYYIYFQTPMYALVQFLDEDSITIAPIGRLKEQEHLEHGGSCIVTRNNEQYKALLVCCNMWKLHVIFSVCICA